MPASTAGPASHNTTTALHEPSALAIGASMTYAEYCTYRANILNDYLKGYIVTWEIRERLLVLDIEYYFKPVIVL